MKNRTAALFALALAFGLPAAGHAQLGLAAHGGYDFDIKELLVGASLHYELAGVPIAGNPLSIAPGVEWYATADGATLLFFDLDGEVTIPATGVEPYVGAGVFLRYISPDIGDSDSDWGLSAFGGLAYAATPTVKPFVEARGRMTQDGTFVARFGVRIKLGAPGM